MGSKVSLFLFVCLFFLCLKKRGDTYMERFACCICVKSVKQFYQSLGIQSLKLTIVTFFEPPAGQFKDRGHTTQIMHSVFIAVCRSAEFITCINLPYVYFKKSVPAAIFWLSALLTQFCQD